MPWRVTIVGSGKWGSAFGGVIQDNARLCFWDQTPANARAAAQKTSGQWNITLADAVENADLIIIAVNSGGFESLLRQLAHCPQPLLWLTKGFVRSDLLLYEVARQYRSAQLCFGALSGPTFADEIEQGLPAAMALAVNHSNQLPILQDMLHRKKLRLYPVDDLIGVCVGGALKNIVAIAAGINDGLALGHNARAAIITRGLAEIIAFNKALGGGDAIEGVAGIGDLILTCTSHLSRNYQLGFAIGQNNPPPANSTVEGATAAPSALKRARQLALDTPIIKTVYEVLEQKISPQQAVDSLLSRPPPPKR